MSHYESLILCTSPRSGSTLLCKLLAAVGKAGNPDSHFHSPSLSDWMRYYNISAEDFGSEQDLLRAIFEAARNRGKGGTDIFALRLQEHSFDFFMQKLAIIHKSNTTESERINAVFGKTLYIHLTRKNKLDQAISYVKATQSGLWHKSADGTELERLSPAKKLTYDSTAIALQLVNFTEMDKRWKLWFDKEGLNPLVVQYDDLSSDPLTVVTKVLDKLGVESTSARKLDLPVAKLADEINADWAKRFRIEHGLHEPH